MKRYDFINYFSRLFLKYYFQLWFTIPREQVARMKEFLRERCPEAVGYCESFWRHKYYWVNLEILQREGFTVYWTRQEVGDIIVTNSFHQVKTKTHIKNKILKSNNYRF